MKMSAEVNVILGKYVGFTAKAVGRQVQHNIDGIECVRPAQDGRGQD